MRRRRAVAASGLASVALVAGGLVWVAQDEAPAGGGTGDTGGSGDGSSASGDDEGAATATADVTRRDLEERVEVEGTLGYGEATELALTGATGAEDDGTEPPADGDSGGGTITGLPAVGTVVDRGRTLVEVDGEPVPLLLGPRPLWRTLGPGVEDGPDVAQLEENLVALGIATPDELTVDEDWTAATTDAVEEWQEALGVEATGSLAPGDAVVVPAAVRVVEHPTPVGGSASGTVVEVTGTTRQVTVDLEASRQTLVTDGQAVEVELPDGTVVAGTVASVGTVATTPEADNPDEAGDPTIEVVVSLDDPAQGAAYDEAPVTVRVVSSAAEGVLAVPVDALLALAEGGYAVERVAADGTTELVGVELGAFADGWVEVTGELAEGERVAVPA
jgi:hypothetical protein